MERGRGRCIHSYSPTIERHRCLRPCASRRGLTGTAREAPRSILAIHASARWCTRTAGSTQTKKGTCLPCGTLPATYTLATPCVLSSCDCAHHKASQPVSDTLVPLCAIPFCRCLQIVKSWDQTNGALPRPDVADRVNICMADRRFRSAVQAIRTHARESTNRILRTYNLCFTNKNTSQI